MPMPKNQAYESIRQNPTIDELRTQFCISPIPEEDDFSFVKYYNQALGGHPRFYQNLEEDKALYSAKHYQYATDADPMSNFRMCGNLIQKLLKPGVDPTIAAALTLMSKQVVGIYEIVGEGKKNTVEGLKDKLRDVRIYGNILEILVDENGSF